MLEFLNSKIKKEAMHHAYLLEGEKDAIFPSLVSLLESFGFKLEGNPDFFNLSLDTFKIKDVEILKSANSQSAVLGGKKILIISVNFLTFDSQGALLKILEEPSSNSHFFMIVPNLNSISKTLASRLNVIKTRSGSDLEFKKEAEAFIKMSKKERVEFIKVFLGKFKKEKEEKEDDEEEVPEESFFLENSARSESLKFLNSLEESLYNKIKGDTPRYSEVFEEIWNSRSLLSNPGVSAKMIMENVALVIPNIL